MPHVQAQRFPIQGALAGFLFGGLQSAFCATLAAFLLIGSLSPVSGNALILDFSFEPEIAPVRLTRLDFLVSGLSLQKTDGTWVDSQAWFAFCRNGTGQGKADGVPPADYRAIRFRVGVDPATNAGDPNLIEPGHVLHPEVNKLHWGWQGGYVFMAVEGYAGDQVPFSYHVANDANLMTVELPVAFRGGGPVTIQLGLDPAAILRGIDPTRDGSATHSRPGDPLAGRLKANIERSFRVRSVKYDAFQELAATPIANEVPGTTSYRLEVSRRLPRVSLPADNPLTVEGVELGRRLFHEQRLSSTNAQSCASCHEPAFSFSDARRFSAGAVGQTGRRNSMPLHNLAWGHTFFWDGRAKTLREQVLAPIEDPAELNEKLDRVVEKLRADAEYPGLFKTAFGSEGITAERIARSLEQFLLTLVSQDSKFDRAARKLATLTDEEKRGLQLFVTEHDPARGLRGADCFHCHGGNLFTSGEFANNGLAPLPAIAGRSEDKGRFEVTRDEKDRGKFKVPSLRNVGVTAPYMHDGRFATLEEVVEHYDRGVHRSATLDPNLAKHPVAGLGLTSEEKRALVAFLKTLTDESFVAPARSPTATAQAR